MIAKPCMFQSRFGCVETACYPRASPKWCSLCWVIRRPDVVKVLDTRRAERADRPRLEQLKGVPWVAFALDTSPRRIKDWLIAHANAKAEPFVEPIGDGGYTVTLGQYTNRVIGLEGKSRPPETYESVAAAAAWAFANDIGNEWDGLTIVLLPLGNKQTERTDVRITSASPEVLPASARLVADIVQSWPETGHVIARFLDPPFNATSDTQPTSVEKRNTITEFPSWVVDGVTPAHVDEFVRRYIRADVGGWSVEAADARLSSLSAVLGSVGEDRFHTAVRIFAAVEVVDETAASGILPLVASRHSTKDAWIVPDPALLGWVDLQEVGRDRVRISVVPGFGYSDVGPNMIPEVRGLFDDLSRELSRVYGSKLTPDVQSASVPAGPNARAAPVDDPAGTEPTLQRAIASGTVATTWEYYKGMLEGGSMPTDEKAAAFLKVSVDTIGRHKRTLRRVGLLAHSKRSMPAADNS